MNHKTLEELVLGNALGTLDAEEQRQLERLLAAYPDQQPDAAAYMDTVATMALASSPRVAPPAALKDRLLSSLPAKQAPAKPAEISASSSGVKGWLKSRYFDLLQPFLTLPESAKSHLEGIDLAPEFITPEAQPWTMTGVPGFRKKVLREDNQCRIQLVQLDAGASIPDHDHEGCEDLYLLTGHLQTEGRLLAPGDFLHFAAGSHHHEAFSMDGCHALMIITKTPPSNARPEPVLA